MVVELTQFDDQQRRKFPEFIRAWHAVERYQWLAQRAESLNGAGLKLVLVQDRPTSIISALTQEVLAPSEVEAIVEQRTTHWLRQRCDIYLDRRSVAAIDRAKNVLTRKITPPETSCTATLLLAIDLLQRELVPQRPAPADGDYPKMLIGGLHEGDLASVNRRKWFASASTEDDGEPLGPCGPGTLKQIVIRKIGSAKIHLYVRQTLYDTNTHEAFCHATIAAGAVVIEDPDGRLARARAEGGL